MRRFKLAYLIKYDLGNGICCKKRNYLGAALLAMVVFLGCFLRFRNYYGNAETVHPQPTLADYLILCFSGRTPYERGEEVFLVPITWLLIFLYPMMLTLHYPMQNLTGHGTQILVRAKRRDLWWFSKCSYVACGVLAYWGIFFITFCLLCLLSHVPCTLRYSGQVIWDIAGYDFIRGPSAADLAIQLFLMPVLIELAMNLAQLCLELFVRPIGAFIIMSILLLLSTYVQTPLLFGVYAMVIRSRWVMTDGVTWIQGAVLRGTIVVLAAAVGNFKFKRRDIIREE